MVPLEGILSGGLKHAGFLSEKNNFPLLAQNGDPVYYGGISEDVVIKGFKYGLNPAHSGAAQPNYFFEGQIIGGAIFKGVEAFFRFGSSGIKVNLNK